MEIGSREEVKMNLLRIVNIDLKSWENKTEAIYLRGLDWIGQLNLGEARKT